MIIQTLDQAEEAVREILSADDPRRAMLRMPQLIASCASADVRSFLEEAQRRMGERYGTRVIRKPVVIPAERDDEPAPRPPPRRAPQRPTEPIAAPEQVDRRETVIDPPEPVADTATVLETAPAAKKDTAEPEKKRPSVPRLRPFSEQAKPKAAAGGASMRTSDPHEIAAELAAADTGEHAELPSYAGRPRERTEVVTLLGESDMVPDPEAQPAENTTKILDRPASPERPPAPGTPKRPTTTVPPRPPTSGDTSVVDLPPPTAPAEPPPRRKTAGLDKTRVYSNPSLDPVPADAAPPPEEELIDELTASRVFEDTIATPAFLEEPEAPAEADPTDDDVAEISSAQVIAEVEDIGVRRAMGNKDVEELPAGLRDIVDELGAAQTLHGDRIIPLPAASAPIEDPVAPDPDAPSGNQVMEIDASELEAMTAARRAAAAAESAADDADGDTDALELDAAQVIEAADPADTAELFGQMMAETEGLAEILPAPISVEGDDGDDPSDDDTREIEGDPTTELLVAEASPSEADTRDGDPEDVFDSIEGALRSGVLPLEAGRQGLDADEAGELFSAFLEAAGGDQAAEDIGEDTIVMDRGATPKRTGAGGRVDALTLFRVIRRIFAETHQRLPAWLVARTIMSDPSGVLELAIAALRLREQREFLAYKETVAELFQRILAARLQWGKTADETGRYLQRVVQAHAAESEHERLALAIDAVLMSDRRVAEVRGYTERGTEGEHAALSLLESLAPGRAQE